MKHFRHGAAAASGRDIDVWYPLPRRGVRVVDGAALEKRCAKAPRVRIPPSPPQTRPSDRPAGATSVGFAVRGGLRERSPSGLWRRTGNAVRGNPSRVRIPPSPPPTRASRTSGVRWLLRSSLTHLQVRSLRSSTPPSPERPAGALTLLSSLAERPGVRWLLRSSLTHLQVRSHLGPTASRSSALDLGERAQAPS